MSVNLSRIFDLVAGYQPETFAHERTIALITFSSWIHWHDNLAVLEEAQTTAAASLIVALSTGELKAKVSARNEIDTIGEHYMRTEAVAAMIVNRDPERLNFADEHDNNLFDLASAEAQLSFLLQVPKTMKPSLNKAHFFIDSCGYSRPHLSKDHDAYHPVSPTTSKRAWGRFAQVAPLLLAARFCDTYDVDILFPEDLVAIKKSQNFSIPKIRKLFETTLNIQVAAQAILKSTGAGRIKYPKLPGPIGNDGPDLPVLTSELHPVPKTPS